MGKLLNALFGSKNDKDSKKEEQEIISSEAEDVKGTDMGYGSYNEEPPAVKNQNDMSGYVNFLVGELETVKRAALEKIKEKNAQLEKKDELIRAKEEEIERAQEKIREKMEELEAKEAEIISKNAKICEMNKDREREIFRAAEREKELLAKADRYKEEKMAEVQEELNRVKVAKYDLYQYLVKIRDTQTTMIADYNKMGMLLKELPNQLDTIIDDEDIKPEIRNLFSDEAAKKEKAVQ